MTRTLIEYEPGEIVRTGSKTFQADQWGVLRPIAKPSSRHASKRRMLKAIARQNEEQQSFFQQREEIAMRRQIRENVAEMVVA